MHNDCPGAARGPCRPTLMPVTLPWRLWELCLASDTDNHNTTTYHRNINLRKKAEDASKSWGGIDVWCLLGLEWARTTCSFCTKESIDTARRSLLKTLDLKVLFKLRESVIKCTGGVCITGALQPSFSAAGAPLEGAVTDFRWWHRSDVSAARYVLEQAWAYSDSAGGVRDQ